MAKNRKTQGDAVRFGTAARAFILCVFLGLSAIGYVWQQQQIMRLNQRKTAIEQALRDLEAQNRRRVEQYESQLLPRALEERVRRMNLGLAPHSPSQVVRLAEPTVGAPAEPAGASRLAAVRGAATADMP